MALLLTSTVSVDTTNGMLIDSFTSEGVHLATVLADMAQSEVLDVHEQKRTVEVTYACTIGSYRHITTVHYASERTDNAETMLFGNAFLKLAESLWDASVTKQAHNELIDTISEQGDKVHELTESVQDALSELSEYLGANIA